MPRMLVMNPAETLHPGQRGHQPGGAGDGEVMGADRQRRAGVHPGPVLHPAGLPLRGQPGRDLPAGRAFPRLHLVFDHLRRRGRGGLEHLPPLHADHGSLCQVLPAAPAGGRTAVHRGIRIGRLLQRRGLRAGLPARLAPAPTYRAATGSSASSYTGYPTRGASRRWKSPCPCGASSFLHPRRQRHDLRVPGGQLRGGGLIPGRGGLAQPGVLGLQLRHPGTQPPRRVG